MLTQPPPRSGLEILYVRAQGTGWGPIDELARLSERLLGGTMTTVMDAGEVSVARKLAAHLPRRRGSARTLLMIASNPAHLAYMTRLTHWLPGYERTAAWVIDSFWTDRISRLAKGFGHLDHIFVTDRDLVDEWKSTTRTDVHWLPWGADTLLAPHSTLGRSTDVLRVGRQPAAWSKDEEIQATAAMLNLAFEGRPPFSSDPRTNQDNVRAALGRAKFVLAFSNLVSPAAYTHPTREYLTGRWTDALAAGATVAGHAPRSADYTLWPEATVPIDHQDLRAGMNQLQEFVHSWTPAKAEYNISQARKTLDWRYRLSDIATILNLSRTSALDRELAILIGPRREPDQ